MSSIVCNDCGTENELPIVFHSMGDGQGTFFTRVQIVGADIVASVSRDLNDWQPLGSTPLATAFPAAPSNLPDQLFVGALGIGCVPRWNATHLVVA